MYNDNMIDGRQSKSPPPLPKEVYDYMAKELHPLHEEIFPFWQELLTLEITISEAITRKNIKEYQQKYIGLAKRWIEAKEKITNVEKLIPPDDPKGKGKIAIILGSGYLQIMQSRESELARIMSDISGTFRDKKNEADFKLVVFLSTTAVVIAVISIIISVFT